MRRQREFYEAEYRNNQEARKKMEITEINAIKARAYVAEMEKRKQELIDQVMIPPEMRLKLFLVRRKRKFTMEIRSVSRKFFNSKSPNSFFSFNPPSFHGDHSAFFISHHHLIAY